MSRKIRILFVCLGNICRSPLAEGVFRKLVLEGELETLFEIDSAGTGSWHVGQQPDERMRATAGQHKVDLETLSARQFVREDLDSFDHIFAMDRNNLHDILYLDTEEVSGHKVRLFREFDPDPDDYQVPDPYYGGEGGFENVFRIVERTSRTILERLSEEYDFRPA